ncbi:MAG: hybrid sensor histidine kinase/response regulator [Deltaproteobacteria bacterium HGW-Deltaproteobacteria-4]|nr:MAG: hybrid sensor histidine kinase/response regulator [Deltaproteobacteria bacterium HGW-Deltaproteobacteria-4]
MRSRPPMSIAGTLPVLLIVDDAEVICQLCAQALTEYRTLQAANGRAALAVLEREAVDLVLTDVMMPGIDGLELLRRIKEQTPNQVVIVMTGFADREMILQALKAGADDFITKPLNLLQLRNLLRKALERQQLREELIELKRMDRLKGEFLGLVSHKLKTPVTSVSLFLQGLAAGSVDPDDPVCQEVLALAQEELENIQLLIRDLLFYSELILQPLPLRRRKSCPLDLVTDLLKDLLPEVSAHGLELNFTPPESLPQLDLDRKQFDFIVRALLLNAIKFTPSGGSVTLEMNATAEFFSLRVSDSGVGIAPAEIPKIFEKFYQIDPHHSGQVRGFGLGLYYVREFVHTHGGTIQVVSSPGAGTTVTVTLPLSGAE